MTCYFCNSQCQSNFNAARRATYFDCPVCGEYGLTSDISLAVDRIKNGKNKLGALMAENALQTKTRFLLTRQTNGPMGEDIGISADEMLRKYPESVPEMIDRTLMNLSRITEHPSDEIHVEEQFKFRFFANDQSSLFYMVKQLSELQYTTYTSSIPGKIRVQARGWERIDSLKRKPSGSRNQAFVAMWFSDEMQSVYEDAIRPAIEQAGLNCVRIDLVQHNNKICDQIMAEIRRSKFVVADFTGNRGGVYFEAGFAQGLGLPVVWLVRKGDLEKVHFDTRQFNHIAYDTNAELNEALLARILGTNLGASTA